MTFGSGGKVTADFFGHEDWGYSVAVQSDGMILVGGSANKGGGDYDFALMRYTPAGTLDTSFGTGGKVTTDFNASSDQAYSMVLQADGKIIAAGWCVRSFSISNDFGLVRYTTTGQLDTSFGTGGRVGTHIGPNPDLGRCVALQSDGKILMVGTSGSSPGDVALVRYTTAGAMDASFGTSGKVLASLGIVPGSGRSLAVQGDGNILLVGGTGGSGSDFALVRYTAAGAVDTSFGAAGKVTTDVGGADAANSIVLQSDGKILVAGGAAGDFALVRYTAAGELDGTFGSGGKVTTDLGGAADSGLSVSVQSDGKILVAGSSNNPTTPGFALVRYLSTGELDASFGSGGKVTTTIASNDVGQSVAVQSDGKILVAGVTRALLADSDFALVRYDGGTSTSLPSPIGHYTLDNSSDFGHDVSGNGNHATEVNNIAAEVDGRIGGAGTFSRTNGSWLKWTGPTNPIANVVAGSYTVALWVKTTLAVGANNSNGYDGAGLFWSDVGSIAHDGIPLALTGSKAAHWIENNDYFGHAVHSTTNVNDGQWHHLAATRDFTTGEMTIYVDGVMEQSAVYDPGVALNDRHEVIFGAGEAAFQYFGGTLDDLQVYDVVLTPAQVAQLAGTSVADVQTDAPTLTLPGNDTVSGSPVSVAFTLPESAAPGSVTLEFGTHLLTLAAGQESAGAHSFSFDPANPTAGGAVASGEAIPDGTYAVTLSYQDALANPAATAVATNVTIDTTPPAGGSFALLPGRYVRGGAALQAALVDWTDAHGPLTYELRIDHVTVMPADLAENISFTAPPADGSYSVEVLIRDSAGNTASVGTTLVVTNLPSPLGYYSLDNPSDFGHDSSGHGNHATTVKGIAADSAGKVGGAGAFNRTSGSWLKWTGAANPIANVIAGNYSVAVWMKTTLTAGSDTAAGYQGAGLFWSDLGGSARDAVPLALTGRKISHWVENSDFSGHSVFSSTNVNDGQWHHVAATRDFNTGEITIYVDGVLEQSAIYYPGVALNARHEIIFGAGEFASQNFGGSLDDLQVYDVALSPAQIALLAGEAPTQLPVLAGLTLSAGSLSPGFDSGTASYTIGVPYAVGSITVTPTVANTNFTVGVRVNGGTFIPVNSGSASAGLPLNVGVNPVEVRVTAANGAIKSYTVAVTRVGAELSPEAGLAGLLLSAGVLNPAFESGTTGYATGVGNSVASLVVTPTAVDANASIAVRANGGSFALVDSGASSTPLALNVGLNAVQVRVTAEDGVTAKTYTVNVKRTAVDTVKPVVKITAPSGGTVAGAFMIGGTVNEAAGLASVTVQLNGAAPMAADLTTDSGKTIPWSVANVSPENGSNLIVVTAVDYNGNIGTATKTVNYVNSAVAALEGSYSAVFVPVAPATVDTTGLVSVTLTRTGAFTGKASLSGVSAPFSGTLKNDGGARFKPVLGTAFDLFDRAEFDSYLGALALSVTASEGLSGTLSTRQSGGSILANFAGRAAPYSRSNPVPSDPFLNVPVGPTPTKGVYNVVFRSPAPASTTHPAGDGYATVTIANTGSVTIVGYLADGSKLSSSSKLRSDASVPFFAPLYRKLGGFGGELNFASALDTDVTGSRFQWTRPGLPRSQYYRDGWPNGLDLTVFGTHYAAPASLDFGQEAADPQHGNAALIFSDGVLLDPVSQPVSVSPGPVAPGQVKLIAGGTYKLSLIPGSGVFSGSFTHDGETDTYRGILLNKGEHRGGFGYFLSVPPPVYGATGQSGRVLIDPNGPQ